MLGYNVNRVLATTELTLGFAVQKCIDTFLRSLKIRVKIHKRQKTIDLDFGVENSFHRILFYLLPPARPFTDNSTPYAVQRSTSSYRWSRLDQPLQGQPEKWSRSLEIGLHMVDKRNRVRGKKLIIISQKGWRRSPSRATASVKLTRSGGPKC